MIGTTTGIFERLSIFDKTNTNEIDGDAMKNTKGTEA